VLERNGGSKIDVLRSVLLYGAETWKVEKENAEIANLHKQVTKEDTKDTLARQNKQHRIVEQNKARTSRNHSKM
jgi:hypothetical protein